MTDKQLLICAAIGAAFIFADPVLARDLGSAASSAVSSAKVIARTLSVFGLILGGLLMQIPGLADFGKRTMGAALLGCFCSFAGPSIVNAFESIFGVG